MKLLNCICGAEAIHYPQSETQSNSIFCVNPNCDVGIKHDQWSDEQIFDHWNDLMKYLKDVRTG